MEKIELTITPAHNDNHAVSVTFDTETAARKEIERRIESDIVFLEDQGTDTQALEEVLENEALSFDELVEKANDALASVAKHNKDYACSSFEYETINEDGEYVEGLN